MNNEADVRSVLLELMKYSLNNFMHDFRNNPYHFLYESDIQCALFSKLRTNVNQEILVRRSSIPAEYSHGDTNLNLINSEYLEKIDLCCLDPIESPNYLLNNPKANIYGLPVLLGIELKFFPGEVSGNFSGFKADEDKLKSIKERGRIKNWISLCFVHSQRIVEFHLKSIHQENSDVIEISDFDNSYVISPENFYKVNLSS